MTPQEAVVAAHAANREWMSGHLGIVDFILSECELENEGNDEYDNVILRNPEEARKAAEALDARGRTFRVQLSLTIPETGWYGSYGNVLNEAGVKEFLENSLFVGTDHVSVSVDAVVDENE